MREPEDSKAPLEVQPRMSIWRKVSALVIGILAALLMLGFNDFGSPSLGKAGQVLASVSFPGLLASIAVAGNVHAFNLRVAAAFNAIFYSFLAWVALSLVSAIVGRFR
jgi:hypothetical protein